MYYWISIILTFFILYSNLFSIENKIWDNWYFGRKAALTFNTNNRLPKALDDSQINTLEGCASISDANGKLLFYTNGVFVYDKNGDIMPNGTGLNGHYTSTQSALIVKRPKSNNLYHIFTTDKGPYEGESDHNFCVSIVDMNLNNGLGDVLFKNFEIYKPVVEKLTAVQHANGEDFWIIARGMNDNKFIISLLTEGGVVSTKTISMGPTYFPYPATPQLALGQLKANPKGDMLATVVYGANNIELYKFDNETGSVTSYIPIPINEDVTALYGVEFSSNNKFLYVNNLYGRIYQYDVSKFDAEKIKNSMRLVYDSLNYDFQKFGQLQLASNGKIYMALSYDTCLAVINKPNVPAPYCSYIPMGIGLNRRLSMFGLPNNVVTGIYYSLDIYGRSICANENDSLELFSIVYPEDNNYVYEWTGPNGFTSNLANPKILMADYKASGKYFCKVSLNGSLFKIDSTEVFVYDNPKAEIIGPRSICPPETIKLSSKYQSPEYIYKWSTSETSSEITITSPGNYYLIIKNPANCYDSTFFKVVNDDNLYIAFEGENKFCKGSSLEISLSKEIYEPLSDYQIKWSTGDTTLSTIVNKEGFYSVTVLKKGGCSGTDSIFVEELDNPTVKLNAEGTIHLCIGDTISLEILDKNPNWNYYWADTKTQDNIRHISESGIYKIIVDNGGVCKDSASVEIIFDEKPNIDLLFDKGLSLCYGDSLIVKPKNINNDNLYKWNDNSTNPEKIIKQSGVYTLYVTNSSLCSDSATFEVFIADKINSQINADKLFICLNDSVTLSSNARYNTYKWSNGDTNDFTRVYLPGKYSVIVSNDLGCLDTSEIEIKGVDFQSTMNKNRIFIDSICQGIEINEHIEINYKSNDKVELSDYVYNGDDFNFSLEDELKQLNSENYRHSIHFKLGKNKPGIYQGEIIITIEKPCFNQFSIPIYVKVYSEYLIEANDITAEPGDSVCIIINITSQCGDDLNQIYSPEFDLLLKSEYFYPLYSKGAQILSNISDGTDRTLHIKVDEQTFPISTKRTIEICGLILAGQKPVSLIEFQSPNWNNEQIHSKFKNGTIAVEACSQEIRRISIFKPINVTISPNPADVYFDINILSQERGKHFIEICSIDGRLLEKIELNNFENINSQSLRIDTHNYNQGMYQIVLKSPWTVLTNNIFIIKN